MNTPTSYIVAFGRSAFIGEFPCEIAGLPRDTRVVIQTERGLEAGQIVGRGSGHSTAQRRIVRPFNSDDRRHWNGLSARETALFADIQSWIGDELPLRTLIDVEFLFDGATVLLHGFWDEVELTETLAASFSKRFELRPLFYDAQAELIVEKPPASAGCGKEGCGSEGGGGCGSCGDGKSGCSTGSCSRGAVKKPDDMKSYLLGLREQMEAASIRTPLH